MTIGVDDGGVSGEVSADQTHGQETGLEVATTAAEALALDAAQMPDGDPGKGQLEGLK